MENSVIIGAGTQGQVFASYLKEAGVNLIGFIDDSQELEGKNILGLPVLGKYNDLFEDTLKNRVQNIYCPIGDNAIRSKYLSTLKKEGYNIPSFIHRSVSIAPDVILGEAIYMLAGNIVMPFTKIGSYLMVNQGSTIAHHVEVGEGVFISSGVNIGASMIVEDRAYIGMGVTAMTGIKKIGKDCLLGAGAVIIRDVPDYATVVGNPGRVIKIKNQTKNMDAIKKNYVYDMAFVGSGISTAFTLLQFLEKIKDVNLEKPIKIAVIEKSKDFYMGLPYGIRSGFSSLLITSLADFLPQPELDFFLKWISNNKLWLLEEFKKDGGTLSKEWLKKHKEDIDNDQWEDLFIPRRFFGEYIKEKVLFQIEKAESKGKIKVNHISVIVNDIINNDGAYQIISEKEKIVSKKVILAIGSPPPRKIWSTDTDESKNNTGIKLFGDPYAVGINNTLKDIDDFLSERKDSPNNVLIIGANASALEMLYKINDDPKRVDHIHKFYFMSTLGIVPDAVEDETKGKKFSPKNLFSLQSSEHLTAEQIVHAAFADLDVAEAMKIGAATTVKPISEAFAKLLGSLEKEELENFACFAGNEIGRRQRCAGQHYSETVMNLKEEKRFEHIAGRFLGLAEQPDGTFKCRYLKTDTAKEEILDEPVNIVINCIGSELLDNQNIPSLYKNLISSETCIPNKSFRGFTVNNDFEAAPNFHVLGPLLAGNLIDDKPVWHVEHCGRIIWLSNLLSKKLSDYFLKPVLKETQIQ